MAERNSQIATQHSTAGNPRDDGLDSVPDLGQIVTQEPGVRQLGRLTLKKNPW